MLKTTTVGSFPRKDKQKDTLRKSTVTDEEAFEALSADGKLVKRPFLITDEREFLVGFKPDLWEQALLQ